MIYYLSLMESRLETRMLKALIPSYAAKYTDDYWDYCYTEYLDEALQRIEDIAKHDIIVWDASIKEAGNELLNIRKANPTAFLFLFASGRMNPMLYVRAGIAPDALWIKPLEKEGLSKVLEESFELIHERIKSSKDKMITILSGNSQKYIELDLIDYMETREKKVYIRMKNQEVSMYGTLDDLMLKLPKYFMRCHRSYVVNMLHVDRIKVAENYIIMKNGDTIPVSRTYKREIKEYGIKNE